MGIIQRLMTSAIAIETPDLILSVAERLFAEHGVDQVSLAQINREAGQRNRSAINYHFGSKQSLPPAKVFIQGLIDGITALVEAPVTGANKRARGPRTSPKR